MRKFAAIIALPLMLAACATGTLQTGVAPAASFAALERPGVQFASARQVIRYYLEPLDVDGPSDEQFGVYPGSSGDRLLLFTAEGLEDDSISEMQWRIVLDQTDVGLRVMGVGVRQKCARSGSDEWTTARCP